MAGDGVGVQLDGGLILMVGGGGGEARAVVVPLKRQKAEKTVLDRFRV